MAYATALGVDPEKAGIFALMELIQAPSLGTITRKGFIDGWKATKCALSFRFLFS
jgi:DCN1-like protein 1/2